MPLPTPTIYYTTDGTQPTTSSAKYSGPIMVSSMETLKAIAVATGNTNSVVASATYIINPVTSVATPTFVPGTGTYTAVQLVTISDATSGAAIYYTTDGSTPTTSSTPYTGHVTVLETETLKAIAVVTGAPLSPVASAVYTVNLLPTVATPTFSPAAGTYTGAQSVTIADATSGATIYYTTDGSTPTTSSTQYAGPITVGSTETLKAIAVATGENDSLVASAAYDINPAVAVATPTFTPAAGAYTSTQSVTIADATSGATIYYTTNGTMPTTSSTPYSGPITVSSTETLEAIAVVDGRHQQRGGIGYLHHNAHDACGRNADLLAGRRDLYVRAVGDHFRCHFGRNHLLHDQRKYAHYLFNRLHRSHYGELDGDTGGDRGRNGRHQQRGGIGCLHHILAGQLYSGCIAWLAYGRFRRHRDGNAVGHAAKRVQLPRKLCVLRAADRGYMLVLSGNGDPVGRGGNDPTDYLCQRAIFSVEAGIPAILPVHRAGCDVLPLRMEKAAQLACLDVDGDCFAGLGLLSGCGGGGGIHHVDSVCARGQYFDSDRNSNLRDMQGTTTITLTLN